MRRTTERADDARRILSPLVESLATTPLEDTTGAREDLSN
jgi:hypothetical protein